MGYEDNIRAAFGGLTEMFPGSDDGTVLKTVLDRAAGNYVPARKKKSIVKTILAGAVATLAIGGAGIFGIYLAGIGAVPMSEVKMAGIGLNNFSAYDIVFGYVDHTIGGVYPDAIFQDMSSEEFTAYEQILTDNGFAGHYPMFGNPKTFAGDLKDGGDAFKKTEHVYLALYDPLTLYAYDVMLKYNNLVKMEYTVENDGKTLTVAYHNTGYPDGIEGDSVEFGHTFMWDIENVSVNNIPKLDEESIKFVEPFYERYNTTYEEAVAGFCETYGYH